MGAESVSNFIELVSKSGLVEPERLASLFEHFKLKYSPEMGCQVSAFKEYLILKGVISSWQSAKLSAGKFKGFFLGDYRLTDQIHTTGTTISFLGCDMRDNSLVVIEVVRTDRFPQGFTYHVKFRQTED